MGEASRKHRRTEEALKEFKRKSRREARPACRRDNNRDGILEESRLSQTNRNSAEIRTWIPRDGDATLTKEGFVFYVIGYLHPPERVIRDLKDVPKKLAKEFEIEWLPYEWKLEDTELVRPAMLYSPSNYDHIIGVFRKNHSGYVVEDPKLKKSLLTVPKTAIKKIYEPSTSLARLFKKEREGHLDDLEDMATKLTSFLLECCRVPLDKFGVHGSISLGMHNPQSDIDVAVYGAENFRKVLAELNN